MNFAKILQLFIIYLFTNYLSGYLTELPTILVGYFTGVAFSTIPLIGSKGRGQVSSHKMVGKDYINTVNRQMASFGAIFTSTYHTKQLRYSSKAT